MTGGRSGEGISDVTVLVVIGCAFAACALVWVWGGIAGELFGGGWPALGGGQLLDVITRLPGHVSDPASAWPETVRSELPGPSGFYASLTLVAIGAVGV